MMIVMMMMMMMMMMTVSTVCILFVKCEEQMKSVVLYTVRIVGIPTVVENRSTKY